MAGATCKLCRGTKYRVLVVDDHPLVRQMLLDLVLLDSERLGVQCLRESATGEEAVVEAATYRPHVVLMDIGLPGISGLEAARRIKEQIPSPEVVIVTSYDERDYREEAASLGAAGFVTKYQAGTDLIPLLSRVMDSLEAG